MNILRPFVVATALFATPVQAQENPDPPVIEYSDRLREVMEIWEQLQQEVPTYVPQCPDLKDKLGFDEYQVEFERPFDAAAVRQEIETLRAWTKGVYHLEVEFLEAEYESETTGYLMCPFTGNDLMKLTYLKELKAVLVKIPPHLITQLEIHTVRFAGRIYDEWHNEPPSQLAGYIHSHSGYVNFIILWPFYHELFHKIDKQMGGLECGENYRADHHEECDPIGIANEHWGQLDKKDPNRRSSWDEEQAEMARILFNLDDPSLYERQYLPLLERRGSRRQLRQVKRWLKDWSGGLLDDNYWEDLHLGRVDESYWATRMDSARD